MKKFILFIIILCLYPLFNILAEQEGMRILVIDKKDTEYKEPHISKTIRKKLEKDNPDWLGEFPSTHAIYYDNNLHICISGNSLKLDLSSLNEYDINSLWLLDVSLEKLDFLEHSKNLEKFVFVYKEKDSKNDILLNLETLTTLPVKNVVIKNYHLKSYMPLTHLPLEKLTLANITSNREQQINIEDFTKIKSLNKIFIDGELKFDRQKEK